MESRNPEPGPEPGKTEPAPREPAREVSQPDASPKESGPGDSASSTQLKCAQDKPFPAAVDQSCQQASDCAIVSHMINCCGTSIVLGVNAKTKASFEAAEKTCAATFPRCGCPTLPSKTDDGSQVIGGAKAAVACVAGRCKTYIQGCGAPCASGKSCFPCTSGPTTTFACAKACQTQADCQANDGPNCVNGAFGARFCSTKTVCNAP